MSPSPAVRRPANLGGVLRQVGVPIATSLYSGLDLSNAYNTAGQQAASAATAAGQKVADVSTAAGAGVNDAAKNAAAGVTGAAGAVQPYQAAGADAVTKLSQLSPFSFNPSDLASTPGYQFTLQQGEKALSNSAAARGGAMSGGALKEGMTYASGLADQTYNDQFKNALAAYGANVNTLTDLSGFGQNANQQSINAAQNAGTFGYQGALEQGNFDTSGAGYQGNATQRAGDVTAQATIGAGLARSNMAQQLGQTVQNYLNPAPGQPAAPPTNPNSTTLRGGNGFYGYRA